MSANLNLDNLQLMIDEKIVIDRISHNFAAGTITLILGRSGSGKSILLETIAGLHRPTYGHIQISNLPTQSGKKLNRNALLKLGIAFQHAEQQLFARTVKEEFDYTLKPYQMPMNEKKQVIKQAISGTLGTEAEWLSRDPFTLSGGQKRRLTMALLEATHSEWLLLDEPTSGLDHQAITQLSEQLRIRRTNGQGTIVVTHDPECFMDIADRVLLLQEGKIIWNGTPDDLTKDPQALLQAGLALPDQLQTMQVLQNAGFNFPAGTNAHDIAVQLAEQGKGQKDQAIMPAISMPIIPASPSTSYSTLRSLAHTKERGSINQFDPRALWLAYMLITPGIWLQTSWIGWLVSGFLALTLIHLSAVPFRVWVKPAIALILFTLITAVAAGLTFGDDALTFTLEPFIETLFRFSRLVMIMLVGFALLFSIPPLRLKRALEQALRSFKRLRAPVDQFAMTAALMVRFIPVLITEWNRFSRIAAARGKYPVRQGSVPVRNMHAVFIPFLSALLRLGETLSIILIIRGVGQEGRTPSMAYRLTFKAHDFGLMLIAACVLAGLIGIETVF